MKLNNLEIGVVGGKGFLGSALVKRLSDCGEVHPIGRNEHSQWRGRKFDVLINANGNSKRYWANENPFQDFKASTVSVYESLINFICGTYIYISSADVYPSPVTPETARENIMIDPAGLSPYGLHKYLSEQIIKIFCPRYLILRCSSLVGDGLKKGPVKDMLANDPLHVSLDSRLQIIDTEEIGEIIKRFIEINIKNEIFNVGGRNSVKIDKIREILHSDSVVLPNAKKQVYHMDVSKLDSVFNLKPSLKYLEEYLLRSGRLSR